MTLKCRAEIFYTCASPGFCHFSTQLLSQQLFSWIRLQSQTLLDSPICGRSEDHLSPFFSFVFCKLDSHSSGSSAFAVILNFLDSWATCEGTRALGDRWRSYSSARLRTPDRVLPWWMIDLYRRPEVCVHHYCLNKWSLYLDCCWCLQFILED